MRKGPDLDALYGSVQPPRAKPGRLSGIQKAERREDGMVIVHPERIVVNPKITPDLSEELQAVRRDLKDGAVYKWNISRNGQLMLAKSKHPNGEKLGWGHPTLVGGLREPEARIGGELRFGKPARTSSTKTTKSAQPSPSARGGGRHRLISRLLSNKGAPKPSFYINNDSGRYSEYIDRKKAMLNNVAIRFQEVDFPVKTQWLDKVKVPLKNPGAYPESDKRKTTGSSKPVESTIKFVARVWRLLGNA